MTTCTIKKAASEHRWEDAVLSLCNALDALPPQRRLAMAREVLDLCESVKALLTSVSVVPNGERANRQNLQSQPVRLIDLEPVEVQLESASEILAGLEARRNGQDRESVLKLASAISSAIFAVQILIWAQGNADAVKQWRRDEVAERGVYDDPEANSVGEILWKQVHSKILREKVFRGRSEEFIYRARPIQSLALSWLHEQLL